MLHLDVIGEGGSEEDEDKESKQSWLNSYRSWMSKLKSCTKYWALNLIDTVFSSAIGCLSMIN